MMQARCQVHVPIHISYVAVLHDDNWRGKILVFSPENKQTQACVWIGYKEDVFLCHDVTVTFPTLVTPGSLAKLNGRVQPPPADYSRAAIRDPANSHGTIDSQDNGMHVQQPILRPWPLHSRLSLLLLSTCGHLEILVMICSETWALRRCIYFHHSSSTGTLIPIDETDGPQTALLKVDDRISEDVYWPPFRN